MRMPANGIFSSPKTHLLSAPCILVEIFLRANVKKKKAKAFRVSRFRQSFSSDIVAVKRLWCVLRPDITVLADWA